MEPTRFAATIAYDGTDFAGSQLQAGGRTVQGDVEEALERLFGQRVRMALAGRTDSGVHARGQVGAFTVATGLDAPTIARALNAELPEDIAVRKLAQVDEAFDPRRWAVSRWYRYTIDNGAERDPLARRTAWHVRQPLDPEPMQAAADAVVGEHDFAACAGRVPDERSTIRNIMSAGWSTVGRCRCFDIEGNAFLPHMVRMLAGAMTRVGRGALSVAEFVRLLASREPGSLGPAAPPQGLCLMAVRYERGYRP